MKKLAIFLLVAFCATALQAQILKKINIPIPALEKTAKVAEVTFIAKDKSYVLVNLYESARRVETVVAEVDGSNEVERVAGKWEPYNMLALNRTLSQSQALAIGVAAEDYLTFYPKVVVLTDEQIKAARIAELEAQIKKLTDELNSLK